MANALPVGPRSLPLPISKNQSTKFRSIKMRLQVYNPSGPFSICLRRLNSKIHIYHVSWIINWAIVWSIHSSALPALPAAPFTSRLSFLFSASKCLLNTECEVVWLLGWVRNENCSETCMLFWIKCSRASTQLNILLYLFYFQFFLASRLFKCGFLLNHFIWHSKVSETRARSCSSTKVAASEHTRWVFPFRLFINLGLALLIVPTNSANPIWPEASFECEWRHKNKCASPFSLLYFSAFLAPKIIT